MDLRLFDDPKPRWKHLTLLRPPQARTPLPSALSSTATSTSSLYSPVTMSRLHARLDYNDTTGQPTPTPRSMDLSKEEERLPSEYGMPNRIPMIPKSSTLADRARWRRRQLQAPTLVTERHHQQHHQQQQQAVLNQAQEQPSWSSLLLSRHKNRDSGMLLSNMDMDMNIDIDMDIDGKDCCTGTSICTGVVTPVEVNIKVAPLPSQSPTTSPFVALSQRTRHQQQPQQPQLQEQQDEQGGSDTTDYGRFHHNRIRQTSLFPGRRQTPGWMSDLLSDLSFRQPQQLHGDEEENDGNDGDDNNELTRQLIYNNFRPDDDYGDICRVDRYQDDTTAVTAKIKVQGPDLDNVVDWTLFTNLSHDDYIFDYGHHSEDDEHDYNTQLYAMQRHNLSNRSKLLDNTILALLETTINRLLVIILSALSSFYILHLLPKLAHDFYIVEILWGLFKTLHWTWYLVAMWPVRLVLWCLATVFHVLTVLIWPSKVTLAIEFHAVIIYFLRQWRIKMMMKEARALE